MRTSTWSGNGTRSGAREGAPNPPPPPPRPPPPPGGGGPGGPPHGAPAPPPPPAPPAAPPPGGGAPLAARQSRFRGGLEGASLRSPRAHYPSLLLLLFPLIDLP